MQVYLDLSAIFPIDIVQIILRLMYDDFSFFHGRMHQLVIDRSRNIREERDKYNRFRIISTRRQVSQEWMRTHSRSEINQEAISIINSTSRRALQRGDNNWYRIFDYISMDMDNFYVGRCVQFILDTNNKQRPTFENDTEISIILTAHEKMTQIQTPREGRSMTHKLCDCRGWTVGNNRCDCGNIKCYLDDSENNLRSLDDTSTFYVNRW
jgi:hypothetical protein